MVEIPRQLAVLLLKHRLASANSAIGSFVFASRSYQSDLPSCRSS